MTRGVQQMAAKMAEAMKEMQEAMKEMPPEQRKMMEQMMRSQMGQTKPTPEDCSEPRIEVRKTGQQATIAGIPGGLLRRPGRWETSIRALDRQGHRRLAGARSPKA